MGRTIELVPLVCTKCGTQIPARPEEVAWVCTQCGQGLLLDETKGLAPLPLYYVTGGNPAGRGRPFWVADGQVAMTRQTFRGNQQSAAHTFWSAPRRFMVPAYAIPMEQLLAQGADLLVKAPALKQCPVAPFEPVVLHLEDVKSIAEFIVLTIEAGRSDMLRDLEFTLNLSQPALWVVC